MNLYESTIQKPKSVVFEISALKEDQKEKINEGIQNNAELKLKLRRQEQFEKELKKIKSDGIDKQLGLTYFSFKKK